MAAQAPTTSKTYKSWTALECIDWMISIDSTKFEKYRNDLTTSLIESKFNGSSMEELDFVDLKVYGITNHDDQKQIYKAIQLLLAGQKKRDSQIKMEMVLDPEADEDDDDDADYKTMLSEKQFLQLTGSGFCRMENDETDNLLLVTLVTGYIRTNHYGQGIIAEIIRIIVDFHGAKFNSDEYVELESGGQKPMYYLVKKENIKLSGSLISLAESHTLSHTLECRQVPGDTLGHLLTYLGHHKGIEPEPLPCPIRSIHMRQICADQWDADYIDGFDKKTTFEIILAANNLDIKPLVHLASAKIAALIKQLDQHEINRMIEEEESYKREQAENNQDAVDNDGNDDKEENEMNGLDENDTK